MASCYAMLCYAMLCNAMPKINGPLQSMEQIICVTETI